MFGVAVVVAINVVDLTMVDDVVVVVVVIVVSDAVFYGGVGLRYGHLSC